MFRSPSSLSSMARHWALERPDQKAYRFLGDGEREADSLTFAALDLRARALATALRRRGAEGQRVLLVLPSGLDFVSCFWACLYSGAVAVPVPPSGRAGEGRVQAVAKDCDAALAITHPLETSPSNDLPGNLPRTSPAELLSSGEKALAELWRPPMTGGDGVALLQYTSGSTRSPRGVVVLEKNLLANLETIRQGFGMVPEDVVGSWLPHFHDMGLVGGILQPVYAGVTAVLMPPLSFLRRPIRWLQLVDRWGVTVTGAPNFGFELCAERLRPSELAGLDLGRWRLAFCGAETVRGETLERFTATLQGTGFNPRAIAPCYGLAEATLLVSVATTGWSEPDRASSLGRVSRVSCGPPAPGVHVDVVDGNTGLAVPEGGIGEIRVAGASVAAGYWRAPAATAEAFRPKASGNGERWLETGDQGFLYRGGLHLTGRSKELVVHRGRNFDPADLEWSAAASHPALRRGRAVAFSTPGRATERVVVLLESARKGVQWQEEDLSVIWTAVRRRLRDNFEIEPWAFHLIGAGGLPRTTSGKVRRSESQKALHAGALLVQASWFKEEKSGEESDEGEGAHGELFVSLLAQRCGLAPDAVDLDAPFTALGLDSLGASEVLHRLEESTGVVLSLAEVLQAESLRQLCGRLDESKPTEASLVVPGEIKSEGDFPLSEGQRSLYYLQHLDPESTAYHLETAAWIEGEGVSPSSLTDALTALCQRHSALRTTFPSREGRPVQRVAAEGGFELQVKEWQGDDTGPSFERLLREAEEEVRRPFDLAQGPLLRARLWVGKNRSFLLLVVHHMVADLWSLTLLWRELAILCNGSQWDRHVLQSRPAVNFHSHCERESRWLDGPEAKAEEEFWRSRLEPLVEALQLPTDRPRPQFQSFRGASLRRRLPAGLLRSVEEVARHAGCTLFVPLLASWHGLLSRWSGLRGFPVGSISSGRFRADTIDTVGYLVNPFVTVADLRQGETFESYVERLGSSIGELLDHVRLPFGRLVQQLQPHRDPSRSPFFQVLFALQVAPGGEPGLASFLAGEEEPRELGPWRLRPVAVEGRGAQFDLSFQVAPGENGAGGVRLEYCTDLFDSTTMQRLLDHWLRYLEGMDRPDCSMEQISILGAAEEHQVVVEGADTRRAHSGLEAGIESASVGAWIRAAGKRHGDAVAVGWETGSLTYQQLLTKSGAMAASLRRAGAGPERVVALVLNRGPELVIAIVGCLRCGAAFLPLDPEDPPARRKRVLERTEPVAVLHPEDVLPEPEPEPEPEGEGEGEGETVEKFWGSVDKENLAYVLFTSGSTGEPKGVLNRHGGLLNRLLWMQEAYSLGSEDRVLQKTPSTFDVSVWELLWPLMLGARLVLAPPGAHRDPESLVSSIRRHGITVVHFVPSLLREFLREPGAELCSSLRLIVCSGEELTADLAAAVFETFGSKIRLENLYGPTEAAIDVSAWRCRPGAPGRPPLGWPISNLYLRVLDGAMGLVPPGALGELFLGGEGLARGYLWDPARTAEAFPPDPFAGHGAGSRLYRSGDLASQTPGKPVQFQGRMDHQVKLRGMRLELGEIENALRLHPRVVDAVAVLRGGSVGGEREAREPPMAGLRRFSGGFHRQRQLVAYLEVGEVVPEVEEVRSFLAQALPVGWLPGRLIVLEQLPRTASGKVDRKSLPDLEGHRPGLRVPFLAPRTEEEQAICSSWSRVLGITPVGVDDNFFHLGGDSIRSLQVRAELERQGWRASVAQMQRFPTPGALALELEPWVKQAPVLGQAFDLVGEEDRSRLPPTAEDAYPLSRTQSAVIFHAQLEPETAMYRDIFVCHCRAPWRPEELHRSVQAAVARHPILRSSFHLSRFSEPLQVVHRRVQAPLWTVDLRREPGSSESRLVGWLEAEKKRPLAWREPPLVRFFALRLGESTFAVVLSFFDAVLDGWSAASLAEEVLSGFARRLRGDEEALPVLDTTYRDFVQLEAEALASEASKEFWSRRLSSLTSRPLPRWPQEEGPAETHILRQEISPTCLEGLERLAEEAGVPLKTVLLSAHLLVLARHQGSTEALTGFESSGRAETRDGDQVLGMHVNILPLALKPGDETLVDWVRSVHEEELAVANHRRFPYSEMTRLRDRHDLSDTVFNFTRFHILGRLEKLEVLEVLGATIFNRTSFALRVDFSVHPSGDRAEIALGADRSKLGEAQVEALARAYGRALALLADKAVRRVLDYDPLSPAQWHQLVTEWNDAPGASPREASELDRLQGGFESWARRAPSALAVEFDGSSVSYGELDARAEQLARRLASNGIGAEDVVALAVERSVDLLVAVLGVLKAGAAYLPLSSRDPRQRQEMLLATACPAALIKARWPEGLGSFPGLVIDLEEGVHEAESDRLLPTRGFSLNLAYLLFTSGSTGHPKAVAVSHGATANLLRSLRGLLRPEPGFRLLALTPLAFDISVFDLFWTWSCGGTVVLTKEEDGGDGIALLGTLRERRIDWLQATPTTWRMLISAGWLGGEGIRILSGGEELTPGLARQLLERGREVWNLYGPTETTVWSAAERLLEASPHPVPFGRPLENTFCFVLDEVLRLTPIAVEGTLFLAGAGLARGYWKDPSQTASTFLPNPFGPEGARMYCSGDRVLCEPDGRLVFFGRSDEQVKIRGHRVEPTEIASKLEGHPSVQQAVVVTAEVAPGHLGLVAHIVVASGRSLLSRDLRGWLSSRLPASMVPSRFVMVASIPRTPHGKVDKKQLASPVGRPTGDRIENLLDRLESLSEEEVEKLLEAKEEPTNQSSLL